MYRSALRICSMPRSPPLFHTAYCATDSPARTQSKDTSGTVSGVFFSDPRVTTLTPAARARWSADWTRVVSTKMRMTASTFSSTAVFSALSWTSGLPWPSEIFGTQPSFLTSDSMALAGRLDPVEAICSGMRVILRPGRGGGLVSGPVHWLSCIPASRSSAAPPRAFSTAASRAAGSTADRSDWAVEQPVSRRITPMMATTTPRLCEAVRAIAMSFLLRIPPVGVTENGRVELCCRHMRSLQRPGRWFGACLAATITSQSDRVRVGKPGGGDSPRQRVVSVIPSDGMTSAWPGGARSGGGGSPRRTVPGPDRPLRLLGRSRDVPGQCGRLRTGTRRRRCRSH